MFNSSFTLIEAFVAAQTPASLTAVVKHVDNALTAKNKVEVIEILLMASAFAPRPSDSLLEKLLVTAYDHRQKYLHSLLLK